MVKRRRQFTKFRRQTAIAIFVTFGLLVIATGITLSQFFQERFDIELITPFFVPYIMISSSLIGFTEVGFRKIGKLLQGKSVVIRPFQLVSLAIYSFVLINGIFTLFGIQLPLASEFVSSQIIAVGAFIIAEGFIGD